MFLVVLIKRKKSKTKKIIEVIPIGTAFAISQTHVFTVNHNMSEKGRVRQEIGLVKEYMDPIKRGDVTIAMKAQFNAHLT